MLPLANKKDVTCPGAILLRGGSYDPHKVKQEDIFKANMMMMDIGLMEDHASIINGMHVVQDMAGVQLAHMASPALAKKGMTIFQSTYPTRPKGIHFFNLPTFFEIFFGIFKPFLTEKMKNRVRNTSTVVYP